MRCIIGFFFFFQAEDGIRDGRVTGVQTCALPISLGVVRIEVILAVEDRALRDPAVERVPELDRPLDRSLVRYGQGAGKRQANGAGARVRLTSEARLAAAEHLRVRLELDVDLEADDRFPVRHGGTPWPSTAVSQY